MIKQQFRKSGFYSSPVTQASVACAASWFVGAFNVLPRVKYQLKIFNFKESIRLIHFSNTSLSSGKLQLITLKVMLPPFFYESWLQDFLWDSVISHQTFNFHSVPKNQPSFRSPNVLLMYSVSHIKCVSNISPLIHQKVSTAYPSLLLSAYIPSQLKYPSFRQY